MADPREQELREKLTRLVDDRFGGDALAAFVHYDTDHDGKVGKAELVELLKDAGVGNVLTRGFWADGIIKRLDADGDGLLTFVEMRAGVGG